MTGINVMGYDLEEVRKEINTPKKSSSYDLCEEIIKEITHMRRYNNMSQQDLAKRSGVKQPMIARFERGINTPNMSTVLKLLAAFGKTLYIGDLKNVELEDGAEPVADDTEQAELPDEDLKTE
ncbi:MAG: helix-turn-helix domain-containing protein [Eubacteriales bacterium]